MAATPKAGKKKEPDERARLSRVRELISILESSSLSELAYEDEDLAVTLRRGGASAPVTHHVAAPEPRPAPAAAPKEEEGVHLVRSPFVGTFYKSSSPDAAAYTDLNKRVRKGQTLCIVEAMKLMNEIKCEVDGTVVEILVANGAAVQYDDPLFKIRVG